MAHLEEGQQVLYVGTVAQGSAGGLLRQPVDLLCCAEHGAGPVAQQAQQLPLTAALHCLHSCQSAHCTCRKLKRISATVGSALYQKALLCVVACIVAAQPKS